MGNGKGVIMWITNMRQAFEDAKITRSTSAAVVNACARAIRGNGGIVKMGKGWNAHLSFRTAQELKAQGIIV
jgi:hypothetical protein